jgi:DNA-directed RNA polymerase subunit delta
MATDQERVFTLTVTVRGTHEGDMLEEAKKKFEELIASDDRFHSAVIFEDLDDPDEDDDLFDDDYDPDEDEDDDDADDWDDDDEDDVLTYDDRFGRDHSMDD